MSDAQLKTNTPTPYIDPSSSKNICQASEHKWPPKVWSALHTLCKIATNEEN